MITCVILLHKNAAISIYFAFWWLIKPQRNWGSYQFGEELN